MKIRKISILFLLITFLSCDKDDGDIINLPPQIRDMVEKIETDKSRYNPGEEVLISVVLKNSFSGDIQVKYKYLTKEIKEETLTANNTIIELQWLPPIDDFRGYVIEFQFIEDGQTVGYASTAIDVSSDWTRFPRYGFLSIFSPNITSTEIVETLNNLKLFHINALQYYDWHNKHHIPLKMDGDNPASTWMDIARRNISFNTVDNYIQESKQRNIASMSYNLLYGAWEDYASDGVSKEWMIFNDVNHQTINKHDLDDNWALSDILVLNPGNMYWQNYIFQRTDMIYQHLDFDGWHLDQLGDRGSVYDYNGNYVSLKSTFLQFLQNLKTTFPDKKMVLNAVNQYGQSEILNAQVDFAYTEVWNPNNSYNNLAQIILDNYSMSNTLLNTVLAAYINYDKADNQGEFNEAAVLMADAVITAFGGNHLELGEHMLGKEYFPNNNLSVSDELNDKLIEYYDFMVAYQNLLRGGEPVELNTEINSEEVSIKDWGAELGSIATIKKTIGDLQVYHLLNFIGVNTLGWRDNSGTLTAPNEQKDFTVNVPISNVSRLIYTSPDWHEGVQEELEFVILNGICSFKIPSLKYWGMIIIE